MGIQGLLPLLRSIEREVHLKDCAGMTLAVDGYVWLHKGAFACAQELCLGQPTQKYISYFMHRVQMFRHYGVTPFIVFDGGYLPSKASTETERLERREASKKKAMGLWHSGRKKEALDQFRRCVDVTPEMAFAVIQALEAAKVEFVVAPYEADAQLAYLEKTGKVQGIVTEDSDLLVFGCKRMIFKLDQYGSGIEIQHAHLNRVQELSFHNWSMTEIRHMCILSGCDYLPSIPGMGLKTAHRLLRRHKTYERVIKDVRMENTSVRVPTNYEQMFEQADLTFLYARVYDIDRKCLVHLNEVPDDLKDLLNTSEYDFLGPLLSPEIAQGIATGRLNPITKEPLTLPSNARSLQIARPLLNTGKENKLPFIPLRPPTPASTKSIQSYFTNQSRSTSSATGSSTKNSATWSDSTIRKREQPLSSENPVNHKRQCSNESMVATLASEVLSTSASLPVTPKKQSVRSSMVVESQSRFFGLQTTTVEMSHEEREEFVCDVVPESPLKARRNVSTVREDSGVGLDEMHLQQQHSKLSLDFASHVITSTSTSTSTSTRISIGRRGDKHVYCEESDVGDESGLEGDEKEDNDVDQQEELSTSQVTTSQLSTLSSTDTDVNGDTGRSGAKKRSEESIVKGWRERFSNPAAPERSAGLAKAFEKMKQCSTAAASRQGTVRRRKAGSLNFSVPTTSAPLPSAPASQPSTSETSRTLEQPASAVAGHGCGRLPLATRTSNASFKRPISVVHVHTHEAKYHLDHKDRLPLMTRTNLPAATPNSSLVSKGLSKPSHASSVKTTGAPGASLQRMLQLDRFKYTPGTSTSS